MSLKKSAFVLAVAAMPLAAQADLRPMDEVAMGDVTGQAGVTIELETKIDIGEVIYTDEGSLGIKDMSIGGANRTDMFQETIDAGIGPLVPISSNLLDRMKVDIDINAGGDAIIRIWPNGTAAPVDFKVTTGAWELSGTDGTTTLLDNLLIEGIFTEFLATVDNSEDKLNFQMRIGIDNMEFDVPFLGIGIRGMRVTGANYDVAPNVLTANALVNLDMYKGTRANGGDALVVDLAQFDADIIIGAIEIGGTSIGSLKFDNLSITETSMKIYGH